MALPFCAASLVVCIVCIDGNDFQNEGLWTSLLLTWYIFNGECTNMIGFYHVPNNQMESAILSCIKKRYYLCSKTDYNLHKNWWLTRWLEEISPRIYSDWKLVRALLKKRNPFAFRPSLVNSIYLDYLQWLQCQVKQSIYSNICMTAYNIMLYIYHQWSMSRMPINQHPSRNYMRRNIDFPLLNTMVIQNSCM